MDISKKLLFLALSSAIASSAVAGPDFVLLQQTRKNQLEREQKTRQIENEQRAAANQKNAISNVKEADELGKDAKKNGADK